MKYFLLILFILFTPSAFAQTTSPLIYKGHFIDPICIDRLAGAGIGRDYEKQVPLKACISGKSKKDKDGSVMQENLNKSDDHSYAAYNYLGARQNKNILIEFFQNTGGLGIFSSILELQIDKSYLKLVTVHAAGDRCNGGIDSASFKNDKLSYSQNVTPYDIINLFYPKNLSAYKDIDGCAICCVATENHIEDKLETITFPKETLSSTNDYLSNDLEFKKARGENPRSAQSCFNKVLRENIVKNGNVWEKNGSVFSQFGKQILNQCEKVIKDPQVIK